MAADLIIPVVFRFVGGGGCVVVGGRRRSFGIDAQVLHHVVHHPALENVGEDLGIETACFVSFGDGGVQVAGLESVGGRKARQEFVEREAFLTAHRCDQRAIFGHGHRKAVVQFGAVVVSHGRMFVVKPDAGGYGPAVQVQGRLVVEGSAPCRQFEVVRDDELVFPDQNIFVGKDMVDSGIDIFEDQFVDTGTFEGYRCPHVVIFEKSEESAQGLPPFGAVAGPEDEVLRYGVFVLALDEGEDRPGLEVLIEDHFVVRVLVTRNARKLHLTAGVAYRDALAQRESIVAARVVVADRKRPFAGRIDLGVGEATLSHVVDG